MDAAAPAGQEPPEIVALRLQLQIAEAQRDQAVAEAQVRVVAPAGQQPSFSGAVRYFLFLSAILPSYIS